MRSIVYLRDQPGIIKKANNDPIEKQRLVFFNVNVVGKYSVTLRSQTKFFQHQRRCSSITLIWGFTTSSSSQTLKSDSIPPLFPYCRLRSSRAATRLLGCCYSIESPKNGFCFHCSSSFMRLEDFCSTQQQRPILLIWQCSSSKHERSSSAIPKKQPLYHRSHFMAWKPIKNCLLQKDVKKWLSLRTEL